MRKAKLIAIVVISILTIIILLRNTEPVKARIFLEPVSISLALLMVLAFVLGFTTGILVATHFLRMKTGKG